MLVQLAVLSVFLLAVRPPHVVVASSRMDIEHARPMPVGDLEPIVKNGLTQRDGKVIGGQEAVVGQLPHQVAVYFVLEDKLTYFCGGSLISARYVLTAAHCTATALKFEVVMGAIKPSNRSEPGRQSFFLDGNSIEHPNYNNRTKYNDIALLKLPVPAKLTAGVQPIRLPSRTQARNNETFVGLPATVSGWGRTSDEYPYISSILNFAPVPVIDNPRCTLFFLSALYGIHSSQVCSGGSEGTNACNGDSGGPLTVLEEDGIPTQIGLVSIGFAKCERGYPTAHTRLTAFLDFLEEYSDVQIRP